MNPLQLEWRIIMKRQNKSRKIIFNNCHHSVVLWYSYNKKSERNCMGNGGPLSVILEKHFRNSLFTNAEHFNNFRSDVTR